MAAMLLLPREIVNNRPEVKTKMILRTSLLLTILACLTFTPSAVVNKHADVSNNHEAAVAPDSLASTSSFYSFRRDLRKCASPRCGGYFVKLVNNTRTRCADNRSALECYVASIEWNGEAEPQNDGALLRGTMRLQGDRNGRFGVLRVTEGWQAASAKVPARTFFRVRDRGIRCI